MRHLITLTYILLLISFGEVNSQKEFLVKDFPNPYKFDEDYVRQLYTDSSGALWMRTFSSILKYNGNQFESMDKYIPPDFKLKNAYMLSGAFLLNYNNKGLKYFDVKKLLLYDIIFPEELKLTSKIEFLDINHIYCISKPLQKIYICKLNGVNLKVDKIIDNLNVDLFFPVNNSTFLYTTNDSLLQFEINKKNRIVLSGLFYPESCKIKDSLIAITSITNFLLYDFKNRNIICNLLTPNGEDGHNISFCDNKLWLFTEKSAYIFNFNLNIFNQVEYITSGVRTAFHMQSFDVIYIKDGNYFVLSNYSGLYKLIENKTYGFVNYNLSNKVLQTKDVSLRCIYYDMPNTEVWTSFNNLGIYNIKLKSDTIFEFKHLLYDSIKNKQTSFLNKIEKDRLNRIWICSNTGFKIINGDKIHASFLNKVWDFVETNDTFWVIGNGLNSSFVNKFDKYGKFLTSYEFRSQNGELNSLWDIEKYDNYLLISSVKGLLAFDVRSGKFVDISEVIRSKYKFDARTWSAKILGQFLYVASQDQGLKRVNLKSGEVIDQLPGINKVFQLECRDGKNLWVNAQGRLICINESGRTYMLKTSNFPLPESISFHGLYQDLDDNIWICGVDGFTKVNTNSLFNSLGTFSCKSFVSQIFINEKLISAYIPSNTIYTVPHDSNNVSFTIANSLLDIAEDMKIRYQLVGYDKDIIQTENTNKITYKNLPYGDYMLQVYVRNSLGLWDITPTQMYINILPPWYLTTAAKITYAILILFTLIGFYLLIKRQFERQQQQEFALLESELKAIKSQLNPHFIFNSLNSIQSHIINNKSQIATRYLNKFAKLLRRALDFSSLDTITLQQEMDWIESYLELEAMRFEEKFKWEIICNEAIDPNIKVPALVMQPLIENALIHGLFPKKSPGSLTIQYKLVPLVKLLECTITDDGVGRKPKQNAADPFKSSHQSKGMLLTNQRLEYLGLKFRLKANILFEDLFHQDGSPAGTRVIVRVPYQLPKEFYY